MSKGKIVNTLESSLKKTSALFIIVIIVSFTVAFSQIEAAQQSVISQEATDIKKNYSGYKPVPEFGGPGSVGYDINEIEKEKEAVSRFPGFDKLLKPWFDAKDYISEEYGLSYSLDYQTLYQAVNTSPGEDDAASGLFRFYGSWALLNRKTDNTGLFVYKLEHRHRIGTDEAPQSLGPEAGSILPTGTQFNEFRNASLGVTNLYWQQRLNEGKITFVAGKVDPTDYLDIYAMVNPLTAFTNLAFSTNPTIAVPNQGLGAAMGAMVNDKMYVVGGLGDANGDATDNDFDTFFEDHEYFTHLELGMTSDFERRYLDNVHITAWHADQRKEAQVPNGWGLAFSVTKFIKDKWMPFVRAGYADGDASLLQASVSTGIGCYFKEYRDLLGIGFNWGKPSANDLDNQYTAECFYRLQIAQHMAITPDLQLIINPALNPDENAIVVFGLRARITF